MISFWNEKLQATQATLCKVITCHFENPSSSHFVDIKGKNWTLFLESATHGLIAQLARTSEWNSVVVGSNHA